MKLLKPMASVLLQLFLAVVISMTTILAGYTVFSFVYSVMMSSRAQAKVSSKAQTTEQHETQKVQSEPSDEELARMLPIAAARAAATKNGTLGNYLIILAADWEKSLDAACEQGHKDADEIWEAQGKTKIPPPLIFLSVLIVGFLFAGLGYKLGYNTGLKTAEENTAEKEP
ncbi:MAG: hypothetical protein HYZ63_03280 [Candidatus Andersenbacteria bacterium]|nr:hypothetical protein [Candidatus Andersenbacteria bacterium]